MDVFHLVLNYIMPGIISILCIVLLFFGFSDRKKRLSMPPAVSGEDAAPKEPPRSKGFLIAGILLLVIAALDFGQGNFVYGIAMLLLGVLMLLKANGVIW